MVGIIKPVKGRMCNTTFKTRPGDWFQSTYIYLRKHQVIKNFKK